MQFAIVIAKEARPNKSQLSTSKKLGRRPPRFGLHVRQALIAAVFFVLALLFAFCGQLIPGPPAVAWPITVLLLGSFFAELPARRSALAANVATALGG